MHSTTSVLASSLSVSYTHLDVYKRQILGSSPFLNFVIGVLSDTFSGLASALEKPGTRRYSLKVLDGSARTIAIVHLSLSIYKREIEIKDIN